MVIHGDDVGVFDEKGGHVVSSSKTTRLKLSDNSSVAQKLGGCQLRFKESTKLHVDIMTFVFYDSPG
jgi:hypothetical protein